MNVRALVAAAALLVASAASAQAPLPAGHPPVGSTPAATATMPAGHPTVPGTTPTMPAGHPAVPATAATMPPGHPNVAAPAGSAMPPGHPAVGAAPSGEMPPGHPNVGAAPSGEMPAGHPAVDGPGKAGSAPPIPEDIVEPAEDLPKGTVEAQLLDGDERPIAGADVRLGIMFQKIAEGESRSEKHLKTGPDGTVRFEGLNNGSNYAYRVTTRSGPGEFASSPFNLKEAGGMRVKLHAFPVLEDLNQTMVGMRGIFYIETRDDVFQIEGMFRVMNLGRTAWVPHDIVLGLPKGFKAFNGRESMFDSRFEALEGRGAKLAGTFPPGQRDLNFSFQVPKPAETTAVFGFEPAPRTVEVRVIAVASNTMTLDVEGFEATQSGTGPSGDHVLVTRKTAGRGSPAVGPFVVTLSGLSVPGPGRWVAVFIALGVAAAGGLAAAGKWRVVPTARAESDRARACDLLLDELVLVTRARERGEIGPQTHEQTRRRLLDALARIGLPREPRKARRAAKPVRA